MKLPYFVYKILSFPDAQITRTLPRRFWNRVKIVENGGPMVEIWETEKIILKPSEIFPGIMTSFQVRKSVVEKIGQASLKLPKGVKLAVIEGYRSLEKQKQAWDRKWSVVKSEHPDWSDEKIDSEVRLIVARPEGITNHVCGGAVDVTLMNENGNFMDFGTDYAPADFVGRRKCPMFAPELTDEQKQNRKILRGAMESAGFVWYPGEWWHYCYGDRMWAVYTNRTECFYGPIEI